MRDITIWQWMVLSTVSFMMLIAVASPILGIVRGVQNPSIAKRSLEPLHPDAWCCSKSTLVIALSLLLATTLSGKRLRHLSRHYGQNLHDRGRTKGRDI
jgi:hypothetical protein